MSELLPERLCSTELNLGDQAPGNKHKPPKVSNMIDWIQCFRLTLPLSPVPSQPELQI